RHLLLPALHAVQGRIGWISEGSLNYVCQRLSVPPAEAYGVAAFYAMLSLEPRPRTVVHVCDDIACRVEGALDLCREMEKRLGPPGAAAAKARATWLRSPCLGQCERAPAVMFQSAGEGRGDWSLAPATPQAVTAGLETGGAPVSRATGRKTSERAAGRGASDKASAPRPGVPSAPQTLAPRAPGLRLLRRVGVADPESLDDYRAHGGYAALRRALAIGPEGVLREVLDSKLVGRGGAAFPTGRKWEAVVRQPVRPHYLVCNADESEPGTFKDRVLMEEDPFAVLEAMTIAGHSTAPKLFCVSGCAVRPGLYEVPFGVTLKQLIDLAGGVRGGRPLQAILLGGAAGVFVTPAEIEVPLTFEGTRAIGATLGSGVVMLFDDTVNLEDTVLRIATFFRDESCGQCVPCRVGTVRQEEALHRLAA